MEVTFYPCLPSTFFFFSEAPASELTFPKRQVGRQPSKAQAGGGGAGGRAGRERWDSPSPEDHQVGVSFLPRCATFPDHW